MSHILTHIHEFRSSQYSTCENCEIWLRTPAAARTSCGVYLHVCVCMCILGGFLWCCWDNWMCDAHQKSPLALGERTFNPSMPLWKAQLKRRLLSTGKHQMVPLFSPPQPCPSVLCCSIRGKAWPLRRYGMTVQMSECVRVTQRKKYILEKADSKSQQAFISQAK